MKTKYLAPPIVLIMISCAIAGALLSTKSETASAGDDEKKAATNANEAKNDDGGFSRYVDGDGKISLPKGYKQNWAHLGGWAVARKSGSDVHEMHDRIALETARTNLLSIRLNKTSSRSERILPPPVDRKFIFDRMYRIYRIEIQLIVRSRQEFKIEQELTKETEDENNRLKVKIAIQSLFPVSSVHSCSNCMHPVYPVNPVKYSSAALRFRCGSI